MWNTVFNKGIPVTKQEAILVLRYLIGALKRAEDENKTALVEFFRGELEVFMDKLELAYEVKEP